jgi:hypothetical protein
LAARPLARRAATFVSQPPVLTVLAALCFLAITYWWLRVDTRPPDNDATRHLGYAWSYFEDMQNGDPWSWFTDFDPGFAYPPLVHLVGALSLLPAGDLDVEKPIFGMNVFFVPMLVAGTYGVGSIAGDRRTGLLAVLVALATPMVISLFHAFMIDGALAAVLALTAWLILRSNRFASPWWSAAAGAATGLGLMTKSPFVFFIAGLIVAVLVRGGWRQWRGLLIFVVLAAAIALPWHIDHFDELRSHTEQVAAFESPSPQVDDSPYPDRWTFENFVWYGWSALNVQAYLPLMLVFLTGLAVSTRRLVREWRARGFRRGPDPSNVMPELLAGGIVGYLGISYLGLDDPRYSLPCLVYCAVIATAWLASAKRAVFITASAVIVAILALNTAIISFGWGSGDPQRITLFNSDSGTQIHRGEVTLIGPGYISGPPDRGADLPLIFTNAFRDGVHIVNVHEQGRTFFFNAGNIRFLLREQDMDTGGDPRALGPNDMYLYRTPEPEPGSCTRSEVDGSYFNFRRGDKRHLAYYRYPPYCPL